MRPGPFIFLVLLAALLCGNPSAVNAFSSFNPLLGGHGAASPLVASLTLPNGGSITNGYDALARLQVTALNNSSGVTLDGYGYQYDPEGLRTNLTRNLGSAASKVSMAYDALGQLTNWVAQEAGGAARLNEQLGWGYDAAHNLHTRANNALSETFSVDAANQLTGVARSGTLTVAGNTLAGVTSLTVNGQTPQVYGDLTFAQPGMVLTNGGNTYTTIAQNAGKSVTNTLAVNLPVSATLLYDNNGNLTNDGLRSFAYDTENELTNVQMAGRWQSAYDGRLILQERDASNNVVVTYTRGRDLAANKVAIQNLANQGVTIIDLGRDPLRLFLILFTQRSPKSFRQTQFR